ncbi:pyridoxamine 5'-phosphate oxidase family protein [Clostridium sp. DJ247]|uniref:pyridoxamine 5'-phosphate oxidase family protein n=1 Tax=Clostridium sp. DJ247 TaxID=2726188 RepID=UPI0016275C9A|nr:pyridoxamine 5'-phosphate oxidase family protein [Clostridium sp. DJ247]MBC2581704.1 pyridoxamine 5'-phosphate oxidase [Clostridium sp. DJ247]
MFREMRRKDRELKNDEAIEILKNSEYGILSTVSQNGYPYGVPLSFIFSNNSIYFHSAIEGHKLDNILNKYSPDYIEKGKAYITNASTKTKVIKISIEHISGKARR